MIGKCLNGLMDDQMNGFDGCMEEWMYGRMVGWMDGWLDGWLDGWMDGRDRLMY